MSQPIAKALGQFSETTIEDEVVLMNLEDGAFFSLTGTARAIWELIDGNRDRAALIAALAAEYGCAEGEIAGDCDAFLADLGKAGLLVRS